MYEPYSQYDLKALPINGCEPFLQVGYVKDPARILSRQAEWILEKFSANAITICYGVAEQITI